MSLYFPGYSVICEIGRGGMATVYRARQVMLDRDVALKVLTPALAADPANAQRFLQEARMLASLAHPHVVPVYDVGVSPEGKHYFSMQLLENGDLTTRLRRGVSEVELVRVLSAVADALAYAHERGYVHRDVTPANILFDNHEKPYLTDFGIARAMTMTSRITATGLSVGTSHYMSPEQARGSEVDPRSDIYSLGVLCFEALVGQPPYDGEDGFAVAYAHVHDPVPELPAGLAKWQPLIDRCMAKDPSERFQSCVEFVDMLRSVALAPGVNSSTRLRRPVALMEMREASAGTVIEKAISSDSARSVPEVDEDHAASEASPMRWVGPTVGALGLAAVLGVFAWKPWASLSERPHEFFDVSNSPATIEHPKEEDHASDPALLAAYGEMSEAQLQTVVDPVKALLALARHDFSARRFTSPPERNALDRYKLIQKIEPNNPDARKGIERVVAVYLELADEQAGDDDLSMWLGYLDRAESLAAEYSVAEVSAQAAARRRDKVTEIQKQAEAALSAWDREKAVLLFERALVVAPDSMALKQGLDRARKVGKAGYVFRDAASSLIPEMIVVNGLAYGRSPVRVDQFRHYWNSEGEARFGKDWPTCRDRESIFRGLKKRNFLAPGYEQGESHPAVCVTAAMADDYVRWLSKTTKQTYRLPTAAEISGIAQQEVKNCSANVRDASFRKKFGGRDSVECDDGYSQASPVNAFKANVSGLFDVGGNVRTWTSECAGSGCRERIAVGRSWGASLQERGPVSFPTDIGFNTIGIRVVRDIH